MAAGDFSQQVNAAKLAANSQHRAFAYKSVEGICSTVAIAVVTETCSNYLYDHVKFLG